MTMPVDAGVIISATLIERKYINEKDYDIPAVPVHADRIGILSVLL